MSISTEFFDVKALQKTWTAFDQVAHVRPIRSAKEYDRAILLMNTLLDAIGDNETHPLSGLLDLLGELVGDYDASHFAIEGIAPNEVLGYLIESRDLKQADLASVVAQSNLSAILSGKRKISAPLAVKLGKFFDVGPAVFLG